MDIKQTLTWRLKPFDGLSPDELYALLKLRSRVFVVEQQCIFLDMDELDKPALHLMGYEGETLVAYTRLLPAGTAYPGFASIGRVVTAPEARGRSYGYALMQQSIARLYDSYGRVPVKIGAQLYLQKFYASLGFAPCGAAYMEDGIAHIPMLRPVDAADDFL